MTSKEPTSPETLHDLDSTSSRKEHAGQAYFVDDGIAHYHPPHNDRLSIHAPVRLMPEIIDLAGAAPPLRRDMERLLAQTDADRQVSLLVAPNYLFSEGQGIFVGEMARLRQPLFWFLGDEFTAAAVSLDWGDDFFIEVAAVPTLEILPERAGAVLAERVAEIPAFIEEYVLDLRPSEHGRRVVARFPEMLRKLAAYTRSGLETDCAVVRVYLPVVAGHNLLMAAELTLAEPPNASLVTAGRFPPAVFPSATPIAERLQRPTSLRFSRDTLEAALDQLSREIGVKITILGIDLQLEGITKNQSFGIDLADRPVAEILVEILRQANPDKLATGPADPRQKLVYIIKSPAVGAAEEIFVTTRARAAERGDDLPAIFRSPGS